MCYLPLLQYSTADEFRQHFEQVYCQGPIYTFDRIAVRFKKDDFDHCCFESSRRDGNKDCFSWKRAQRLDWIKGALQDPQSERYVGWDKKKKRYDRGRRVAIVNGDYVVVISFLGPDRARFVTAFVADTPPRPGRPSSVDQIRKAPKWS
jgi:hypothetical protein